MDKYKFINNPKKELIELSNENDQLELKLNLDEIKEIDGKLHCEKCNYTIKKEEHTGELYCNKCGQTLEWDLSKRFNEQKDIKSKFDMLSTYLFRPSNLLYDQSSFFSSLELLNKNQKKIVLNYFIGKSINTEIELHNAKIEIDNLNTSLNDLKTRISDIENKYDGSIEPYKKELQCETENLKIDMEEDFKKIVEQEIEAQKKDIMENLEVYPNMKIDIKKMKITLNIMMDLFEKGFNFQDILIKARMQPVENQYNESSLMLEPDFSSDNEGNYLGCNLSSQSLGIFKRFDEYDNSY